MYPTIQQFSTSISASRYIFSTRQVVICFPTRASSIPRSWARATTFLMTYLFTEMVSTGKFFATWLITLPLWTGTRPCGHFLPTVTWLLARFRTRSAITCMARLLTVVMSTQQLPPARLTTGPLLGTTAYHPRFLFTTVARHGHRLRTRGTGSWMTQEQTGVSTFRLQVSATCLPTGVGH